MTQIKMALIRLPHGESLDLPAYESDQAAGLDLRAACPQNEPIQIPPGERVLVPTGFVFEIPENHEGQIRPRSGLAYKHGITCLNTPGTIDADYRGEVKVLLINHGTKSYTIKRAERIAQMVVAPVIQVEIHETTQIGKTNRGASGFGSTGT